MAGTFREPQDFSDWITKSWIPNIYVYSVQKCRFSSKSNRFSALISEVIYPASFSSIGLGIRLAFSKRHL